MAATCANQINASFLLLNHFSCRYTTIEHFQMIKNDARKYTKANIFLLEDFRYFNFYTVKV